MQAKWSFLLWAACCTSRAKALNREASSVMDGNGQICSCVMTRASCGLQVIHMPACIRALCTWVSSWMHACCGCCLSVGRSVINEVASQAGICKHATTYQYAASPSPLSPPKKPNKSIHPRTSPSPQCTHARLHFGRRLSPLVCICNEPATTQRLRVDALIASLAPVSLAVALPRCLVRL